MIDELSRLWWLFSIRGLLALTFSYICYLLSSSMATLVLRPAGFVSMQVIFSFYIIASGFITLTGGLYAYDTRLKHRYALLTSSFCSIGLGVALFATLVLSIPMIFALFGLHALLVGVFYLSIALGMRRERRSALILALAGLCSVVAGIVFIVRRNADTASTTSSMAAYSAIFGLLLVVLSLSLRQGRSRDTLTAG